MFLARREFGKRIYVYPNCGAERFSRAWLFDGVSPETGRQTAAALTVWMAGGIAATGHSRSEAISNLQTAEEAARHV